MSSVIYSSIRQWHSCAWIWWSYWGTYARIACSIKSSWTATIEESEHIEYQHVSTVPLASRPACSSAPAGWQYWALSTCTEFGQSVRGLASEWYPSICIECIITSTWKNGLYLARRRATPSVAPCPCTHKAFNDLMDNKASASSCSPKGQPLSSSLSSFWHPLARCLRPSPLSPDIPRRIHLRLPPNSPIYAKPLSDKPPCRR